MEQQNAMTSFTNPIIDIPLCQSCLARNNKNINFQPRMEHTNF